MAIYVPFNEADNRYEKGGPRYYEDHGFTGKVGGSMNPTTDRNPRYNKGRDDTKQRLKDEDSMPDHVTDAESDLYKAARKERKQIGKASDAVLVHKYHGRNLNSKNDPNREFSEEETQAAKDAARRHYRKLDKIHHNSAIFEAVRLI